MLKLNFNIKLFIVSLLTVLGLSACATHGPAHTGFLSDYSKLQKNPDTEGSRIYFNPDKSLKNYSRFIINPVQVRLSSKGKMWNVKKDQLHAISQYVHDQFVSELTKSNYNIVNTPGPETLILRVAITEVAPTRMINRHSSMMVGGISLGGASGEAELIDALTGDVVVAAVESQKGEKGFNGLTKYGNAKNVMDRWVKRLIIRMDQEHGKTRN
ncbi:MAG: hypothetical protein NPINA01_21630 [Nitrospinaceae bacterium]|nr:MAG: hypothetical protein NPINA01_21630 [Nitrospinaceae bacterium]